MLIGGLLYLFMLELEEMRLIRNFQLRATFCLSTAPLGNSEVEGKDENGHDVSSGIGWDEESAHAV